MQCELFVVTHRKDFDYLSWCVRSIEKFATGFAGLTILCPKGQGADSWKAAGYEKLPFPLTVMEGDEWPDRGKLWQMAQAVRADQWCASEFIAHCDSDCIFTEPVTPEDYFIGGRPILRYEPFDRLVQRVPPVQRWRECTERNLPFAITVETMRAFPIIYHRGLYSRTRELIEQTVNQPCDDYIRAQENSFPQGFCEYNTLGNVALRIFPELYHAAEQTDDVVRPPNKLIQMWSHGPIDQPQPILIDGTHQTIVPIELAKKFLE